MPRETLVIRADASAEIGSGHVMRCLALAQAWQHASGRVIFALATGATDFEQRLRCEGAEVAKIAAMPGGEEDAVQTKNVCREVDASWLALDGFHFSHAYCAKVANGTCRVLVVDDDGARAPYRCDMVLNVNPQAAEAMYVHRHEHTQLLLGPPHALIRREFLKFGRRSSRVPDQARRILITFGGADPKNVTLAVLQVLHKMNHFPLELSVVAGASNPHGTALRRAVQDSPHTARLLSNVENMAELMSKSDLAITAGGGTCYELAFMGVPMFLMVMARNHERTVEAYGQARAAVAAGWFDSVTKKELRISLQKIIGNHNLREELRKNASRMVDGLGSQRVVEAMRRMSQQKQGKAS
jgi:UDP-2,4-diacetamido-2,4,6-trideoxy-beta-L-altropyranose hydrolase